MISALKKFARKNEDAKSRAANMPSGVSSMGQSLQKKFGRGVQYNMKIVIKGDRNTGKSSLLGRFQGKPFTEHYIPTSEIQVCSINWNYRAADDVVKVEVWDVVDKGKKKAASDGLKLANDISAPDDQVPGVLDAEFVDVYKGAHGCVIMLDITKQWTFKYVQRELPKIPKNIPVLILANFLDMSEHRVVQLGEIVDFIRYLDRGENAALVEYGQCCLKNSFGLKFVHKFFNIPFLNLQRETLEKQLQVNKEDMESTVEELSFHRNSEEQDYDKFLLYLEKKANEKKKPSPSQPTPKESVKSSPSPNLLSTTTKSSSKSTNLSTTDSPGGSSTVIGQSSSQAIDDFVPGDTIDSEFLGKTEKEVDVKSRNSENENKDSDSDNEGNPMVSGFQDISSTEEDAIGELGTFSVAKPQEDVDIEITSDESEDEAAPVVQTPEDQHDEQAVSPQKLKPENEIVLNDDDNNFMDAWLDSPNTNPSDQMRNGKSGLGDSSTKDLVRDEEPGAYEDRKLASKTSIKQADGAANITGDNTEEKKERHSGTKNKNGEEGKERRRSKHKHKKKSKTKENEEDGESSERKSKSKKKHRHKHSSREKNDSDGKDYQSF